MATVDVDALVKADLEALVAINPISVYYVDESPDDDTLPVQNGQVVPHIIVHPGRPMTSNTGRGIVSARLDPIDTYVIIEVVAPNYAIAKQLGNAIIDAFLGKKYPPHTNEFVLRRTVGGVEEIEARSIPNTYHFAAQFNYKTNL